MMLVLLGATPQQTAWKYTQIASRYIVGTGNKQQTVEEIYNILFEGNMGASIKFEGGDVRMIHYRNEDGSGRTRHLFMHFIGGSPTIIKAETWRMETGKKLIIYIIMT